MIENLFDRIKLVKAVISDPQTAKRVSQAAATRLIGDYKQRIFLQGFASDNTQIGLYSTNPFYINPDDPEKFIGVKKPALKPIGKTGKTVFKSTGKPHKTAYLTRGYEQLRGLVGKNNPTVNLDYSSSLRVSIKVVPVGDSYSVEITDPLLAEIMQAQELRFGKIIHEPTAEEKEGGEEAARLELLAILEEID